MEQVPAQVQHVIDNIKKRTSKLTMGLGLGGGIIALLFGFVIAKAILGIAAIGAALGVAIVTGAVVFYGTPVLLTKLQNKKIQMILEEARNNPVETLMAEFAAEQKEFREFEKAVTEWSGELDNLIEKNKRLSKGFSAQDLEDLKRKEDLMLEDLEGTQQQLLEMADQLTEKESELQRVKNWWEIGLAMEKVNAKSLSARRDDILTKIKCETALDSVNKKLGTNTAQMRMRLMQRQAKAGKPSQLTHQPADVIEMPIASKQGVRS